MERTGLLPANDPLTGRLAPAPLFKPDGRALQTACRLAAQQIRLTIPAAMEAELARAAYAAYITYVTQNAYNAYITYIAYTTYIT